MQGNKSGHDPFEWLSSIHSGYRAHTVSHDSNLFPPNRGRLEEKFVAPMGKEDLSDPDFIGAIALVYVARSGKTRKYLSNS